MTTNLLARRDPVAPRQGHAILSVAELYLNRHQCFRAEIILRGGKSIVSIARWKNAPTGARRTGQALEFGAHRLAAVTTLLTKVQCLIDSLDLEEARHESGL